MKFVKVHTSANEVSHTYWVGKPNAEILIERVQAPLYGDVSVTRYALRTLGESLEGGGRPFVDVALFTTLGEAKAAAAGLVVAA